MAYGSQASLDQAKLPLERASELLSKKLAGSRDMSVRSLDDEILRELVGAVAYLFDAVRYLKCEAEEEQASAYEPTEEIEE